MSLCTIDGCEQQASKCGLCWAHYKRRQQQKPLFVPTRATYASPLDVVAAAAERYASAEEESDFVKARDNLRKASARHGQANFRLKVSQRTRRALSMARKRGVHLGRPVLVDGEKARAALAEHRTVARAAKALGVSERTLRRALRRPDKNGGF